MKNANKTFISSTFWTERSGPVAALACFKGDGTIEKLGKNKQYRSIHKKKLKKNCYQI